jgi:hypothetical protein
MHAISKIVAASVAMAIISVPSPAQQYSASAHANATSSTVIPHNLALLKGKRVAVGRMALCVPNTYQPNLAYAGKTATVVGFKPNASLNGINMALLPASTRAMFDNLKLGGVLLFQFDDGTKLETCGPQGSDQLSPNLDLAPGQTIDQAADAPDTPALSVANAAPNASCPASVVKLSSGTNFGHTLAEALTTSEFQRQLDATSHGGVSKHYLDVRVRNDSGKPIRAFEFAAVYADTMGDASTSTMFVSQNTKAIPAGVIFKASAMDRELTMQSGVGEVSVFVSRVRFEDDTFWTDNGSHSCRLRTALK